MIFRLRTPDQPCFEFEAPDREALESPACQAAPPGSQLEDTNGNVLSVRELKYTLIGWTAPWRPADSWWMSNSRL